MKSDFIKYITFIFIVIAVSSCYDDYETDYDYSTVYFASQKPLRTIVSDTDMKIKVGVAIGGKREVNTNDWATFSISPELLDNTSFTLLPDSYYKLSDPDKMTISNSNLAIADVGIDFTDAFYNDAASYQQHYAIPFRLKDHSLDEIGVTTDGEKKDYSIVAVKAISRYHGTYYVKGKKTKLDAGGNPSSDPDDITVYDNADLSRNLTRDLSSLSRYEIRRPGFANNPVVAAESIVLTISSDGTSASIAAGGATPITNASASLDFTKEQPELNLVYRFEAAGEKYEVRETLIRRQSPEKDLRFEEWQ